MPILVQFFCRILQFAFAAALAGVLLSCATKKEKNSPPASPAAATARKKGSSIPTPTPTPAPTPQAHYTATVKVDGVDVVQNQPLASDSEAATAGPTPAATPIPKVSPSPAPKPKPASTNFLTGTWRKIFPPKPTPTPAPGETGGMTIRVSTEEGGQTEQVVHEGANPGPASEAVPAPTPIQIKLRPTEGFLMRMWHRIFPKKKEPPVAAPPQWVGTIKLINEHDGYALIDSPTSFSVPAGETLNSVGGDTESGVLRVSADRNPPFFIADIVSGKPTAGARVYSPKP